MKTVNLTTQEIEAICNLADNVEQIYNRIESPYYNGAFVSWQCMATSLTSVARKHIEEKEITVTNAVAVIDLLAQAYAITDLTIGMYGDNWPYRDDLNAFIRRVNFCKALVAVELDKI